jgi:hypothetical protein
VCFESLLHRRLSCTTGTTLSRARLLGNPKSDTTVTVCSPVEKPKPVCTPCLDCALCPPQLLYMVCLTSAEDRKGSRKDEAGSNPYLHRSPRPCASAFCAVNSSAPSLSCPPPVQAPTSTAGTSQRLKLQPVDQENTHGHSAPCSNRPVRVLEVLQSVTRLFTASRSGQQHRAAPCPPAAPGRHHLWGKK